MCVSLFFVQTITLSVEMGEVHAPGDRGEEGHLLEDEVKESQGVHILVTFGPWHPPVHTGWTKLEVIFEDPLFSSFLIDVNVDVISLHNRLSTVWFFSFFLHCSVCGCSQPSKITLLRSLFTLALNACNDAISANGVKPIDLADDFQLVCVCLCACVCVRIIFFFLPCLSFVLLYTILVEGKVKHFGTFKMTINYNNS